MAQRDAAAYTPELKAYFPCLPAAARICCINTCIRSLHPISALLSFCRHICARSQDETILPTDFNSAGVIVDDELNAMMVRPLAPGVTLHALIDACHSGTAMDLPYRAKQGSDGRFAWKVRGCCVWCVWGRVGGCLVVGGCWWAGGG